MRRSRGNWRSDDSRSCIFRRRNARRTSIQVWRLQRCSFGKTFGWVCPRTSWLAQLARHLCRLVLVRRTHWVHRATPGELTALPTGQAERGFALVRLEPSFAALDACGRGGCCERLGEPSGLHGVHPSWNVDALAAECNPQSSSAAARLGCPDAFRPPWGTVCMTRRPMPSTSRRGRVHTLSWR